MNDGVRFNAKALGATLAGLLVLALAARLTDAGASPIGAILIAGIVMAVGCGLLLAVKSFGLVKSTLILVAVFVAMTILRLLWKLVVFAWR